MIIAYGCGRWRESWIRPGPDGAPACVVPHVVIDGPGGGPLRLQDGQYAFQSAPPPGLDVPGQLAFVERYLVSRADPWSKAQRRLIALYFARLRARIEDARDELRGVLGPLAAVFDYRAFAFAAPRPLPRACPVLPDGVRIGLHCAFWTGGALTVIELTGRDTADPARLAALRRLENNGAVIVRLDASRLGEDDLPELFPRFWEGVPIPCGPFKAHGMEAFRRPDFRDQAPGCTAPR